MTDKAVAVLQPRVLFNPEKDTDRAKKAAERLIDIVKQNKWNIKIGPSEHLKYEAWQTVGKYYNVSVATGEVETVEIANVSGFKAKAWVIDNKTGIRVGEAEAYCMKDEPNWKTKPVFQLASMAQTRAGSKALRQMFGFVVALAGYNPTPAEEMTEDTIQKTSTASANTVNTDFPISENQKSYIRKLLIWKGKTEAGLNVSLKQEYGKTLDELSAHQASDIISKLKTLSSKPEEKEEPIDAEFTDEELDKIDEGITNQ